MLRCHCCNIEKSLDEFYNKKRGKLGKDSYCKICRNIKNKEYIKTEAGKKSRRKIWKKLYENEEFREKSREKCKLYKKNNPEKIKDYNNKYYKNNIEYHKEYKEVNKDTYAHHAAKRRAQKLQATPSWLTEEHYEEIKDFYTIAKMFQIYTGLTYHVDHIMPLQGETVCGLHVPWNLQILEASENISKRNRLLEEYLYE